MVSDPLDVTVSDLHLGLSVGLATRRGRKICTLLTSDQCGGGTDLLVPDLERLRPNAVHDREEPRLVGILEHLDAVGGWQIETPHGVLTGKLLQTK